MIRKLIVFACLVAFTTKASAQVVSYQQKAVPDTLTFAERFSISTNAFDWLILLPNISVEYDIRPEEWNKWSVGFKLRGNWKAWNKEGFKPALVYNLIEGRFEVRNYFRTRLINADNEKYFPQPEGLWQKLITNRRDSVVKRPNLTYYRGAYVSFSKYSMKVFGPTGYQGVAANAGVLVGVVRPLYQFANGNSMDLDLGISGGICFTKADEFGYDQENNCYPVKKRNSWQIVPFPVIDEARVALIYRFGDGSNMITHKYRDRYDVDEAYRTRYQYRIDSLLEANARAAAEKKVIDALYHQFDSIFNIVHPPLLKNYQQVEADKKAAQKAAADALVQHKKDSVQAIALAKKNAKYMQDSLAKAAKDSVSAAQKAAKHAQDSISRAAKDSISAAKKALKHPAAADSISSDGATVDSTSAESPAVPESMPTAEPEVTPAAEDTTTPTYEEVPTEETTPAESDTPAEAPVSPASSEDSDNSESSESSENSESPATPDSPDSPAVPESSDQPNNTPEEKEAEE